MTGDQELQRHEALVRGLQNPLAYPEPVDRVERIDTHISTVLLAGEHAYKIKKPLNLGFLDFSTLMQRRQACADEVRLNRRTAPAIYLEVAVITGSIDAPRIETASAQTGDAEVIEYAVRMRRFDPNQTLDQLALRGQLGVDVVAELAAAVADLHQHATVVPEFGSPDRIEHWALDNFRAMRDHVQSADDRARLDALEAWTRSEARAQAALMAERVHTGCVRECHGDLHLGNVALIDGAPVVFDAIEFNRELRCIDVISDMAFAFMDLADHGLPRLAWRLASAYLERTGDYAGLPLLRYYAVYRALVRAKVALVRLRQPQLPHPVRLREHMSFEHYLALAERLRGEGAALLAATTGLSGSGKSTVALALAERVGGVRIRSDVERKRLFGLAPSRASDGSIYTVEANEKTYVRLVECARNGLVARVPVIIDAACLRRAERLRFRDLARELAAHFALIVCSAPTEILRARVAARAASGTDASEADLVVLERQLGWYEAPADDEQAWAHHVDTSQHSAQVEAICDRLGKALLVSSAAIPS
ncbi:MAG TPA: AAA family ATPase [Burkholderiaceae bacterium]|nr:AAA family ATPase [Burkholderiaceae bacterium]